MNTDNWVVLGVMVAALGLIFTILKHLGIIKPIPTANDRMKKKIRNKLNELENKECFLVSETHLRDMIYWGHLTRTPLLKKRFFSLFIESIEELADSKKIICIDRKELFCRYRHPLFSDTDPFPPYDSRTPKKPSDYSLKKCDPDMYIGLKTPKCEKTIEHYKARAADKFEVISRHY